MPPTPRPNILYVDLTAATVRREPLPPGMREQASGGRGLAGVFLEASAHLACDDPGAAICFFPGRLAGLDLPGAGRTAVTGLSPRTGGLARGGLGGRIGGALARAGLAGVVVTGRAEQPCGLAVRDGQAELAAAGPLWGQSTDAVFAALGAYDGALAIGPAASAGSPLAGIAADRRHMAGSGLGLAMAAKNLLFVAATGHGAPPAADPPALARARAAMERLIAASPALAGPCGLGRFGTAALVDLTSGRRMQPTDNWRRTFFPNVAAVNAPRLEALFPGHGVACPGCPVPCRRIAPGGRLLPDLDALSHFTALLGLADPGLAVAANALCQDSGLEAAGCAVALAGYAEAAGRPLGAPRVMELLAAMAAMDGEGRAISLAAPVMAVKGLALPAFDPRGAYGLALSLAVATAGPDPWEGGCVAHELLRKPVATDRFAFEGKARAVFLGENAAAAVASLGGCPFLSLAVGLEEWALALSAVSGEAVTAGELARLGEGAVLRERRLNATRGLDVAADDLPQRFFTEPGSAGDGIDVPPLPRPAFLAAREKYYRLRGLDAAGRPLPQGWAGKEASWTR